LSKRTQKIHGVSIAWSVEDIEPVSIFSIVKKNSKNPWCLFHLKQDRHWKYIVWNPSKINKNRGDRRFVRDPKLNRRESFERSSNSVVKEETNQRRLIRGEKIITNSVMLISSIAHEVKLVEVEDIVTTTSKQRNFDTREF